VQSAHLRPGSTIVVIDDRVVQDRIFTGVRGETVRKGSEEPAV
jgi:hypothetical protein